MKELLYSWPELVSMGVDTCDGSGAQMLAGIGALALVVVLAYALSEPPNFSNPREFGLYRRGACLWVLLLTSQFFAPALGTCVSVALLLIRPTRSAITQTVRLAEDLFEPEIEAVRSRFTRSARDRSLSRADPLPPGTLGDQ